MEELNTKGLASGLRVLHMNGSASNRGGDSNPAFLESLVRWGGATCTEEEEEEVEEVNLKGDASGLSVITFCSESSSQS